MVQTVTTVIRVICITLTLLVAHPVSATPLSQPAAQPDLIVEKIDVSPSNPGPGTVGDITVTIKNIGDASATGFAVHLYVDPADEPPNLSTQETTRTFYGLDPIAPGDTWSFSRTGHTFANADPAIYAWVDRNDQVEESNETNNIFPAAPPTEGDEYEQDDSCETAQTIGINAPPQAHNLFRENDQPDMDWVQFESVAGVIYVVSAIPVGTDADLVLDSRVRCDSFGLGGGQTITITAVANTTYFIGVGHVNTDYGLENDYQLVVKSDERCTRFEPNNLCPLAQPIYPGGEAISSNLCTKGDEDWFTFEVHAGVQYTVTASNVGSKANVDMRLMDGCDGAVIGDGLNLSYTAPQQQFAVLRIKNEDAQAQGLDTEYSVRVDVDNTGKCQEDRYERGEGGDDDLAYAQPINVDGNPQERNVCPAGDVDWVRFSAVEGKTYTIETFGLGENADTKLCLHIPSSNEIVCDDDTGAGLGSRLQLENANTEDYYLSIQDVNPNVAGPKTRYHLQVLSQPCRADEYESDNTRETATPLVPDNTTQTHTICGIADADWVSFDATAATPYTIETIDGGPDADTVVELFDLTGTRIASNDDYSDGVTSQLTYTTTNAGKYFVKVRLFNPLRYGEGTGYGIRIRPGTANSCESQTNTSNGNSCLPEEKFPEHSPSEPFQEGARTLILFNEQRLIALYGTPTTQQLLTKLEKLADHDSVKGEIVKIDDLAGIQGLYDEWQNGWSPGKANEIGDKIRSFIRSYSGNHAGLQYLILVGDDRVLPFYRIPDKTTTDPESTYSEVNELHPTGVALRQNYFLTDDFYGSTSNTTRNGLTFYIPDLVTGRLVEDPADMESFIDRFLLDATPTIDNVLVTGWDFVADVAQNNCNRWRETLSDNNLTKVNCDMIGEFWTQQQFRNGRLSTEPVYGIQSINGHAAHFADQAPDKALVTADQIAANTSIDFGGGLVYSPGCHGGLNVPPANIGVSEGLLGEFIAVDLPEIFLKKGANYVGNTGNGYGTDSGIELSERLVQLFTDEMSRTTYGNALVTAKQRYFNQMVGQPTPFDQKVLHELTFYGLPMFLPEFAQQATRSADVQDPFPGVGFELSGLSLGDNLTTRSVNIDFQNGQLEPNVTGNGEYLSLSGQSQGRPGQPIQPLFFHELEETNNLRSVIVRDASYVVKDNVDPVVSTPTNEHITDKSEQTLDSNAGWMPASPLRVQSGAVGATFAMQVSQYNAISGQQRQFNTLQADLIYSTSTDRTPPSVIVVDGLYSEKTGLVTVKVGATDSSGIHSVVLVHVEDEQAREGKWQSIELTFDSAARKWIGTFPGDAQTRFFAQILDRDGNLRNANNKGHWYASSQSLFDAENEGHRLFLPFVSR